MTAALPYPQITFRCLRRQDMPVLLRFAKAYYRHQHRPYNARTAGAAARTLIKRPRQGRIWLICNRKQPIGYAVTTFGFSLELGGRDMILQELYIVPTRRGRGIGACAISFIKSEAKLLGMHALHLEVSHWNRAAKRLYKKFGFRVREHYSFHSLRLVPKPPKKKPKRRKTRTRRR